MAPSVAGRTRRKTACASIDPAHVDADVQHRGITLILYARAIAGGTRSSSDRVG
jgi:hypothetical protein